MKCMLTLAVLMFTISLNAAPADSIAGTDIFIPPLEKILDAALQNSNLLKAHKAAEKGLMSELNAEKKNWMDYIFIEGTANYGMFDQVIVNESTVQGTSGTGFLSRGEQARYYGGVGIKLPLSSLSNRRNNIRIREARLEQSHYEIQQSISDVRSLIIEEYYRLQYLQESMRTFLEVYQTLEISLKKTEKELLNGQTDLNDYALLSSTTGKAKNDYQKAKSNFLAQYHRLQELSGLYFSKTK